MIDFQSLKTKLSTLLVKKKKYKHDISLLIWITVAVVILWSIIICLTFDLVDFNGIWNSRRNIKTVSLTDVQSLLYALYPFQYDAVRHPLKAVGNSLVTVDDTFSNIFNKPNKEIFIDKRRTVTNHLAPLNKLYLPPPECLKPYYKAHRRTTVDEVRKKCLNFY